MATSSCGNRCPQAGGTYEKLRFASARSDTVDAMHSELARQISGERIGALSLSFGGTTMPFNGGKKAEGRLWPIAS